MTTTVVLIRHGRTAWNLEGRIQGHRDIGLSDRGRADFAGRRLPERFATFEVHASPLARAVETAHLLGLEPRLDARLKEMNWGRWEGERRSELRARGGEAVARSEALGADFRPPGGESPRELMARLSDWLKSAAAAAGSGVVAVTHKGVMRAALALATGWDFRGSAPAKLDWDRLHTFEVEPDGQLRIAELNQLFADGCRDKPHATPHAQESIAVDPGEAGSQ